ncbi:MAG: hypothetical protein ABI651_12465 [Verrucomicrobiota bacterium]
MNTSRELTTKVSPSPLSEVGPASDLSRYSPRAENSFAAFIVRAKDSRSFPVKPPKSGSTTSSGGMPFGQLTNKSHGSIQDDEEQFYKKRDSIKAEGLAALQMPNGDVTPNTLLPHLSEAPIRYGALSKSPGATKDDLTTAGDAPSGTIAEDVRTAAGASEPGKGGIEPRDSKKGLENDSNDLRFETISAEATRASEPAGTENGFASSPGGSVGGQPAPGSPPPNEPDAITSSSAASQAAVIPGIGDPTPLKSSAVVAGESTGTNTADGTLGAQLEGVMKTMIKGKKSAVNLEQKLPQASLAETDTTDSDFSGKQKAGDASAVIDAGLAIPWLPLALDDRFQGWSAKLESVSGTKSVSTSEQIFFQISKQAVALKHFNADSMAVVLKPDSETAIFLHLQLQNGQVEVHARFERGDYQALRAGWEQLRESLASQGIRLGPLHNSTSNDYTNASQTSDKSGYGKGEKYSDPQTPDRSDARSEGFAGLRTEVSGRPMSKLSVGEKRQWEHWA